MKEFFRDITLGHGATRERCEFVALYLLQRHGVEPDRFPQPLRRGIPPHDGRLRCRCVKYPIMSLNCRPIMLRTCPISVLMEPHLYPMKSVEGHKMNNHPFSPKPLDPKWIDSFHPLIAFNLVVRSRMEISPASEGHRIRIVRDV